MDVMDFGFDEEDDLSSALGTETLAAWDMVPEGFDNTPRAHVPTRYYPIRKVVYYQAIYRPACWDHWPEVHRCPFPRQTVPTE
jgi:hypothetical protein